MNSLRIGYILSALLAGLFFVSFAIPYEEQIKYQLTSEFQLQDAAYVEEIESFYEKGFEGYFTGKADVEIYYKIFKQPNPESAAILISSGRTEAAIKYKEVIFDLYNNGYSIYIHDHRGQGLSGRMTEDPDMGYVDTFQFYIDDMKYFYDNYLLKGKHKKKYLLAHSMGGAIGVSYLIQHPEDFNAAAFSSPMLGFIAATCKATKLLKGPDPKYAIGQDQYNDDKLSFKKNKLTGCEIRYNRMNEAFAKVKRARLGGATYQWLYKSCQQFDYISSNIKSIQTPFILFSAQKEKIVSRKAHKQFIEEAISLGKNCELIELENAMHEILIESDEIRNKTMNQTLELFEKY